MSNYVNVTSGGPQGSTFAFFFVFWIYINDVRGLFNRNFSLGEDIKTVG